MSEKGAAKSAVAITIRKGFKPDDVSIKALLYGNPGTGKTTVGATAPDALILDCDGGLLSVADNQSVSYIDIATPVDLENVIMYLKESGEECGFRSVVLDSISALQAKARDMVLRETGKSDPDQDVYQRATHRVARWIRQLGDLPFNLILTAGETSEKDEESGRILWQPAISHSLRQTVYELVDIQVRLRVDRSKDGKPVYRGICVAGHDFVAKDRTGHLPDRWENPSVMDMVTAKKQKIKGLKLEEEVR